MSGGCKGTGKKKGPGAGGADILTPGGVGAGGAALPERFEGAPVAEQYAPVYFAYDSALIEPSEEAKLDAIAELLARDSRLSVTLEGHCDERGSNEYNLALGERRSLAARVYLMRRGIDGARIQTKSLGEEMPADPGHNEGAWQKNRRVEFRVAQ
jgi:peptidoglycan-associated lipoprotein